MVVTTYESVRCTIEIKTIQPIIRKQVIDMAILYVANGNGEMIDLSTLELDPYDDDN